MRPACSASCSMATWKNSASATCCSGTTPMSLAFSDHLAPGLIVYDCMDELSAFRGAPPELVEREVELMCRANLVFTGGYSLYEAKRQRHDNAHPFPSSVDVEHFAAARRSTTRTIRQRFRIRAWASA